jgi:hypothetical protein
MFEARAVTIMTALPEIPGIIEGAMTISPEPGDRIAFRVLISASSEQADGWECIELVVNSEYVRQALAATNKSGPSRTQIIDDPPTLPCHIGLKLQ